MYLQHASLKKWGNVFRCKYVTFSSGALTQAIRNFAKSLESWLTGAMMNIPEEMVRIKVSARL